MWYEQIKSSNLVEQSSPQFSPVIRYNFILLLHSLQRELAFSQIRWSGFDRLFAYFHSVVSNHWTGLWTGMLDWINGLDWSTGLLNWTLNLKWIFCATWESVEWVNFSHIPKGETEIFLCGKLAWPHYSEATADTSQTITYSLILKTEIFAVKSHSQKFKNHKIFIAHVHGEWIMFQSSTTSNYLVVPTPIQTCQRVYLW